MEIIRGMHNIRPRHRGCVLTIGNFDGVHHGHQVLLAHVVAKGKELGVPAGVITFEPMPREFFRGAVRPARLTRFREKIMLLCQANIDRVICLPFNEQLVNVTAETVIDVLVISLGIRYIVVGDDFRFGRGAEGDYAMLQAAGRKHGFEVSQLGTLLFDHERVSSTRVREVLGDADFELAEKLLGHPYFIMGRVVYGRKLGRQLGSPTANIRLQRYRAALEGVYTVEVDGVGPAPRRGIANIGVRPTVDGREPLLEVHIFDFDEDIYGRLLKVTFRHKIRDERQFESLEALKAQITRDISAAREWFEAA
ncbi:MAG: bifunctional riboflavin kinase/FAD synthetase [Gammaproteobacteria bacterium]